VHLRRDDTDQSMAMIDSARERVLRESSAEMLVLINAREAEIRVRLGDLDRAGALLDNTERGLPGDTASAPPPGSGARTTTPIHRSASSSAEVGPRWAGTSSPRRTRKAGSWTRRQP
jgi:hypothetical protein